MDPRYNLITIPTAVGEKTEAQLCGLNMAKVTQLSNEGA